MSHVIPIFRIFDLKLARAFYLEWMGFKLDWEHTFEENSPVYMQVALDDITLHLSEHHGDACPGAKAFVVFTGDLEAYHARLLAKPYKYNRPGLEDAFWGGKCMEVTDPFGNRLLFSNSGGAIEK